MKCLVLGPGGMGFFSILGSLKSIEERLDLIQEISGSSAGSVLALFLGLGMSVDTILDITVSADTTDILNSMQLKSVINRFGSICCDTVKSKLRSMCGCDPTFRDLKKKVYISSYSLKRGKTEYFSVDTHPDMKVIDAVYMSISIPFVFSCSFLNDDIYVDGSTTEKTPCNPFLHYRNEDVVVLEIKINDYTDTGDVKNFFEFAKLVFVRLLNCRHDYPQFTNRIVTSIDAQQVIKFDMSPEERLALYIKGFKEKIICL